MIDIVRDKRVLRGMARQGHIVWPVVLAGEDHRRFSYVGARNHSSAFTYRGRDYRIEYFSPMSNIPMPAPLNTPEAVLKAGVIYSADNGALICLHCAGMSAKYAGRDISGKKVVAMPRTANAAWRAQFKEDMHCEGRCTNYGEALPAFTVAVRRRIGAMEICERHGPRGGLKKFFVRHGAEILQEKSKYSLAVKWAKTQPST